jgi:hypothetical protein
MALACEQIRSEFSALLDEELNPEDKELVEEHLSECAECLRELHSFKKVSDLYFYHHPVNAPEDFEERFQRALEPQPAGRIIPWAAYRFAAAAAILVVVGLTAWQVAERNPGEIELTQAMPAAVEEAESRSEVAPPTETVAGREAKDLNLPSAAPAPAPAAAPPPMLDGDGILDEAVEGTSLGVEEVELAAVAPEQSVMRNRSIGRTGEFGGGGGGFATPPSLESAEAAKIDKISDVATKAEPMADEVPETPMPEMVERRTELDNSDDLAPMKKAESSETTLGQRLMVTPAKPAPTAVDKDVSEAAKGATKQVQWRKRDFVVEKDVLKQSDYSDEAVKVIDVSSRGWTELLDKHPDLVKLVDGTKKVIVALDKTWYEIRPRKADDAPSSPAP